MGDVRCDVCVAEEEDLQHFLLECLEFREEKEETIKLQQPSEENQNEVIEKKLLLTQKELKKRRLY